MHSLHPPVILVVLSRVLLDDYLFWWQRIIPLAPIDAIIHIRDLMIFRFSLVAQVQTCRHLHNNLIAFLMSTASSQHILLSPLTLPSVSLMDGIKI